MHACNVMVPPDDDADMETTNWKDYESEPDVITEEKMGSGQSERQEQERGSTNV
ncbi:uncharacterized protein B0T23DRAFT_324234 [Neurospora hispaniola]|uniref:Uncharacterized protein n=1 Tax=Neurospora hispaniola TaxID=588809 RepID=A0AAJ0I0I7_9PEZI|nr:hypothetical protein B0T23DRAFT_324234 [Neurospora hispaniola]